MNLLSVTKYLYVITQNFMLTNDVLATKLRKNKIFFGVQRILLSDGQ